MRSGLPISMEKWKTCNYFYFDYIMHAIKLVLQFDQIGFDMHRK